MADPPAGIPPASRRLAIARPVAARRGAPAPPQVQACGPSTAGPDGSRRPSGPVAAGAAWIDHRISPNSSICLRHPQFGSFRHMLHSRCRCRCDLIPFERVVSAWKARIWRRILPRPPAGCRAFRMIGMPEDGSRRDLANRRPKGRRADGPKIISPGAVGTERRTEAACQLGAGNTLAGTPLIRRQIVPRSPSLLSYANRSLPG